MALRGKQKRGKKRKKSLKISIIFVIGFFFILYFFVSLKADDIGTELLVGLQNVPPSLIKPIPDQTWALNTNFTNAFDLDDYFLDNETLTYNSSSLKNITVLINQSTNIVSFYPDYGFYGNESIVFTAYDPFTSTNSNIVMLNVTADNEPPTWSSLSKDKNDIVQNMIVTFSATWQDNIALKNYIFSIKQEAGWINQSSSTFSGTQNTSSYGIQISAPSGTTVFWRFYAFDTSGNMNFTYIQNFTIISSPIPPSSSSSEESTISGIIKKTIKRAEKGFITEPSNSFKIDIKQGDSVRITIKITNTGNINASFNVGIEGLEEFNKIISIENFTLSPRKSKIVTIEFNADKRIMPDVYYGKIKVSSGGVTQEIPVVLTVKPIISELGIDVSVLKEYKKIRPNSLVKANITLENLKEIDPRNVTLYYSITDFNGKIIDSSQEMFEFSKKLISFERNFTIPENTKKGEYIFLARAISNREIVIDSDIFEVGEEFSVAGFIKANFLLFFLIIASFIVAILMMYYHRDRERIRLLNLYLMISQMKKLMKEGKLDEAISIFVRIKTAYGEPVSETTLKNKEELKKEMEKLDKNVNLNVLKIPVEKPDAEKKEDKIEKTDDETEKTKEKDTENSSETPSETEKQIQEKEEKPINESLEKQKKSALKEKAVKKPKKNSKRESKKEPSKEIKNTNEEK